MTFKTKFKIDGEVIYNGLLHTIDGVQITVTKYSKEILYTMTSAFGHVLAKEEDLVIQNIVRG